MNYIHYRPGYPKSRHGQAVLTMRDDENPWPDDDTVATYPVEGAVPNLDQHYYSVALDGPEGARVWLFVPRYDQRAYDEVNTKVAKKWLRNSFDVTKLTVVMVRWLTVAEC